MEIGFIGLGNMGQPMARRLIEAGHKLVVYDTRNDAVAPLVALGAQLASSPADVADRVETVMSSLPSLKISEKVATGEGGVIHGKRVKRYVDLSTTGSRVAAKIAAALAKKNIVQIDSPVSGGVGGANKGTLAVMVSGPQADIDVVKDALSVLGKVFVIGHKPGMAQTMKLANNFLSATAMAATSEAVAMGVKAGLDPAVMIDVINAGSGRTTASDGKFPQAILPRTFNYGFATALMLKDVRLCATKPGRWMFQLGDERCPRSMGNDQYGIRWRQRFHGHRQNDRATRRRHCGREEIMSDDIHEVYAVCYASHARRRSENYIFGDPHDEMTSIAYYVWVIKGPHGVFVCDTGFDEAAARERGRKIIHPVGEGLQALGVQPDKVDHVIATHMHWDHAGNYDLFPNARYHIQDTEMAYATGRCMCHQMLRIPFSERDVHAMVSKIFAYRCEFHDGSEELAPGITVHKIGGHSKGLQCVRVKTKRGYVVVASDCIHLYSHIDEGRVFPITYSVGDTLEGYKTIQKLASSRQHIVPGHDPEVLKLYPAVKSGLENWVVRLDVEPKA